MSCSTTNGLRENCCSRPGAAYWPGRPLASGRSGRPAGSRLALRDRRPVNRPSGASMADRRAGLPRSSQIATSLQVSPPRKMDQTMIKFLRNLGITSDVAYLAGMLSIGASIAAWTASSRMENAPGDKADRWGIYVGLWAPTFMALGNAIKHDETS